LQDKADDDHEDQGDRHADAHPLHEIELGVGLLLQETDGDEVASSGRVPRRIGIKIAAVAVLLIHIESIAAVIMKAMRMRIGEPRTSRSCVSDRAMRRSRPCRVMALAMKKPPMNRKISGSAYGANAARLSVTPTTIMAGAISSAVTAMGNTSVTQATITAAKTAARWWARGSSPSGANQTATKWVRLARSARKLRCYRFGPKVDQT